MLFLLAVGLVAFVQPTSVKCGSAAVAQTQTANGPDSSTAVLKVSTEDDHAKDTHLCMADYKLEVARNSDKPYAAQLLSSDNDWGRKISIALGGFSNDGKEIVGIFSEGGASPTQQVFEYNTDDESIRLFDLRKLAAGLKPDKCLINAQIVGTLKSGAIVIALRSGNNCVRSSEWVLNSVNGPMQRLHKHSDVQTLYGTGSTR